MRFYQRCLCALLCCALLFPVFSINVSAEDVETKDFNVTINTHFFNDWTTYDYSLTVIPNNDTKEYTSYVIDKGIPYGTFGATDRETFVIEYLDFSPLSKKGKDTTITLHNARISVLYQNANMTPQTQYDYDIESCRALVHYSNGTYKYYDDVTIEEQARPGIYNFSVSFTADYDVQRIEFISVNTFRLSQTLDTHTKTTITVGEMAQSEPALSISIVSEEVKLLNGIIEWLKGIKEGITNLFDNVKTGFTNILSKANDIFNKIVELPQLIWNKIRDGLMSLFVPSASDLSNITDRFHSILSVKLGAIYEVSNLLFDSWNNISNYDESDSITFPLVEIDLPNNNTFAFGGYDVLIVPPNFEFLATLCKSFVGMVCTLSFCNGLRRRYDEVFR